MEEELNDIVFLLDEAIYVVERRFFNTFHTG